MLLELNKCLLNSQLTVRTTAPPHAHLTHTLLGPCRAARGELMEGRAPRVCSVSGTEARPVPRARVQPPAV